MPSEKTASAVNILKGNLAAGWNLLEGSSADYTDLGVARRFGGAAAAYSLRDIGAMNGEVVRVRREPHDTSAGIDDEINFSANQVQSGVLEDWVNGKLESTLPADVATAAAAYSLRKVKATYSGNAVRIRRSSDDIEVDVAFDSDDKVSASSAITNIAEQGGEIGSTTATDLNGFLNETLTVGVAVEGGDGADRPDSFSNATNSSFTATVTEVAGGYFPYRTNLNDVIVVSFDIVLTGSASPSLTTSDGIDTVQNRSNSEVISSSGSYTKTLTCDQNNGTATHIRFADSDDGTFAVTNFRVVSHTHQAFVHTWYDQAGSNNATQATDANQPKIAESGVLLADGLDFDGSNDFLQTSSGVSITTSNDLSFSIVYKPDVTNADMTLLSQEDGTGTGRSWYRMETDADISTLIGGSSKVFFTAGENTSEKLSTVIFDDSASTIDGFKNSVSGTQGTSVNMEAASGEINIGESKNSDSRFNGTIKEIIIYLSDQTDNRFKIESNINNYYGLYNDEVNFTSVVSPGTLTSTITKSDGTTESASTSQTVTTNSKNSIKYSYDSSSEGTGNIFTRYMLDSSSDFIGLAQNDTVQVSVFVEEITSGATLKLILNDNYTALSDEADISSVGFHSVTLTRNSTSGTEDNLQFKSLGLAGAVTISVKDIKASRIARNGFVETWYDQSSNGNDATQGTAGNQPSIVKNGLLSSDGLIFDGSNDFLQTSTQVLTGTETGANSMYAVFKQTSGDAGYICGSAGSQSGSDFVGQSLYGNNAGSVFALSNGNNINKPERDNIPITQNSTVLVSANYSNNNTNTLNKNANNNGYANGISAYDFNAGSKFTIGARDGSTATAVLLNGSIKEIIAYDADKTSDRVEIETDINNHYNIF